MTWEQQRKDLGNLKDYISDPFRLIFSHNPKLHKYNTANKFAISNSYCKIILISTQFSIAIYKVTSIQREKSCTKNDYFWHTHLFISEQQKASRYTWIPIICSKLHTFYHVIYIIYFYIYLPRYVYTIVCTYIANGVRNLFNWCETLSKGTVERGGMHPRCYRPPAGNIVGAFYHKL